MKIGVLLIFSVILASCNFETKKISSEEVFEIESRSLNWKEVDEYPAFEGCRDQTEISGARECFQKEVVENVYAYLARQQAVVSKAIADTIYLYLEINRKGKPIVDSIGVDSALVRELPEIQLWLRQSIDSLPKIFPASKRGIPVSTKFRMPILVKAE